MKNTKQVVFIIMTVMLLVLFSLSGYNHIKIDILEKRVKVLESK